MRPLTGRGATLLELLLGLVLLAMFATVMLAVVRGAGAVASRAARSLVAERTTVTLRTFLQQELRDAEGSDVVPVSPQRVGLDRPIGDATPCLDSAGMILIPDAAWQGTRSVMAGRDDVLLLIDPAGEQWLRLPVDSVGSGRCPSDGTLATTLAVAPHTGAGVALRVVEPVELGAYRSGASDWLGLRSLGRLAPVQPFAGPLVPGVARFAWSSDRLDVLVQPVGSGAATVGIPLQSP